MTFKTADLCDLHVDDLQVGDAHEGKVQVVHPGLFNFAGKSRFHGEIVTIRALGDFSQVRKQVRSKGMGKVLVVDNDASMQVAMLGDLLTAAGVDNGWQGVVINGCIRDAADIAAMDIGVKALATVPARGSKADLGELNVELAFLGGVFRPGEFLYSDEDGILLSSTALI
jgi:regulator of ribonuclease activity A